MIKEKFGKYPLLRCPGPSGRGPAMAKPTDQAWRLPELFPPIGEQFGSWVNSEEGKLSHVYAATYRGDLPRLEISSIMRSP